MKKPFAALLLSSIVMFGVVSCGQPVEEIHHEEEEKKEEEPFPTLDMNKRVNDLQESDYNLVPYYFIKRCNDATSYKSVTKGQTAATVLFITTHQSIDVTTIKSEYSYMKNESHSALVNTTHEAYYYGDKTLVKNNTEAEFHSETKEEYLQNYGVDPYGKSLEGYLINSKTLTSVEKLESEEDYKFKVVLNTELASNNVKIQMKKFGGLDAYPNIKKVEMTLTVKEDFLPVKIELVSEYSATLGATSECHQEYTVGYSNFNEQIEISNLEEIKTKFEA